MNLLELKNEVDNAIQMAKEDERNLKEIIVSLQIDDKADPHHGYVQSDNDVELHYDNDCNASGCVLTAWRDTSNDKG